MKYTVYYKNIYQQTNIKGAWQRDIKCCRVYKDEALGYVTAWVCEDRAVVICFTPYKKRK